MQIRKTLHVAIHDSAIDTTARMLIRQQLCYPNSEDTCLKRVSGRPVGAFTCLQKSEIGSEILDGGARRYPGGAGFSN